MKEEYTTTYVALGGRGKQRKLTGDADLVGEAVSFPYSYSKSI
jgi:hypothetical protein